MAASFVQSSFTALRRRPLVACAIPMALMAVMAGRRLSPTPAAPPAGKQLASHTEIAHAMSNGATLVDLRGATERELQPASNRALLWDFNADATVPLSAMPMDKAAPIIVY